MMLAERGAISTPTSSMRSKKVADRFAEIAQNFRDEPGDE